MNYSQLSTAIQEYLQNSEATFVGQIDRFIRQAEERINRAVLIPDLKKTATSSFTLGDEYLAKPTDFLATFALTLTDGDGNQAALLPKDYSFMREAYPNPSTTGTPAYYANFNDGNWVVAPTPDAAYAVTVHYYYDPDSIVDAGTSWHGDHAESVLLHGCLIEAYTFMKGSQDLLDLYRRRYEDAIQDLAGLGMAILRDDYRDGTSVR